jgi:hypothetical protein
VTRSVESLDRVRMQMEVGQLDLYCREDMSRQARTETVRWGWVQCGWSGLVWSGLVSDKCHISLQIDQYDEILLCVFIIMNHHLDCRTIGERVGRRLCSVTLHNGEMSQVQEL